MGNSSDNVRLNRQVATVMDVIKRTQIGGVDRVVKSTPSNIGWTFHNVSSINSESQFTGVCRIRLLST